MNPFLRSFLRLSVVFYLLPSAAGWLPAHAQDKPAPNYSVKVSGYYLFQGGFALSAAFGFWHRFNTLQPGTNLSLNILGRASHLGNRNFWSNYWQVNAVLSPLLTINMAGRKSAMYEEINPFYLGNSGAVYSDYRTSITLGTSFMAMPKGTDKNIMTNRNRSQQLIYVQVRGGLGRVNNLIINLYEDYLPITDNGWLQGLADNRDRFYTGGGNAQVRLSERMKYKLFFEVYTGSSYIDHFDFPDLVVDEYLPDKRVRKRRYAFQDAGQEQFNKARAVHCLEYSLFPGGLPAVAPGELLTFPIQHRMNLQLYAGRQGSGPMWMQNFIHDKIRINKLDLNRQAIHNGFGSHKKDLETYHHFRPFNPDNKLLFGAGLDHTFSPQ